MRPLTKEDVLDKAIPQLSGVRGTDEDIWKRARTDEAVARHLMEAWGATQQALLRVSPSRLENLNKAEMEILGKARKDRATENCGVTTEVSSETLAMGDLFERVNVLLKEHASINGSLTKRYTFIMLPDDVILDSAEFPGADPETVSRLLEEGAWVQFLTLHQAMTEHVWADERQRARWATLYQRMLERELIKLDEMRAVTRRRQALQHGRRRVSRSMRS